MPGYEVDVVDGELQSVAGLEPPSRAVEALPVRVRPECYANEGVGGLRHATADVPPVVPVDTAPRDGPFVRVTGLLHSLPGGRTRLCNAEPSEDACPASAPRVLSAFHDRPGWEWHVGSERGMFLARGVRAGFAHVALLDRWSRRTVSGVAADT